MKRIDVVMKFVLVIAIVLCLLTILDYLALHDIYKDYASKAVLSYLNLALPSELPGWTNTQLEWNAVTLNYILKIFLAITNILLIVILRNMVRKGAGRNLEQP